MNCSHQKTLTYALKSADQRDFTKRLEDFLCSGEHDFGMQFLTPTTMRGARARSMLATTKTKDTDGVGDTNYKLIETETECDYPSDDKRRSSVRKMRKQVLVPVKFQNCVECGAIYFRSNCVAIKPRQYCYRLETIPAGLLCSFFNLQNEQKKVWLRPAIEMKDPYGQQLYLNGRKRIIDGIYKMGVKFQQARETIHIAIEIIDQFYLRMSQQHTSDEFKENFMQPRQVILHQVTSLLLASKYDEVDDNITAIRDLRTYIKSQLDQLGKKDPNLVPTFDQIVECERSLLVYFNWNLKFLLPLHFIRLQLANGILFSNELKFERSANLSETDVVQLKQELAKALTTEALSLSDLLITKGACFLRKEQPSDIAAAVVYFARKNILFSEQAAKLVKVQNLWPDELILMTRCTESQIKKLLSNPLEETYMAEVGSSTQATATRVPERRVNPHSKVSKVRSADQKREQQIVNPISPVQAKPALQVSSKKLAQRLNTDCKPQEKPLFPHYEGDLKQAQSSAKMFASQEKLESGIEHSKQGMAVRKLLNQASEHQKQSGPRHSSFHTKVNLAQSQPLRIGGTSVGSKEPKVSTFQLGSLTASAGQLPPPTSSSTHGGSMLQNLHPSVSSSHHNLKSNLAKKEGQVLQPQYIPTNQANTKSGALISQYNKQSHQEGQLENPESRIVSQQLSCEQIQKQQLHLDEVHECLPEINSNSKKPSQPYETISKQTLKGAIQNMQKDQMPERRHQMSQGSLGSFSQAPLSSSKRPKNSIGFAETSQVLVAEKKVSKTKKSNSNQQGKKDLQNSKRNNGANRKGNQRVLCLPQNQIQSLISDTHKLNAPNSTRNKLINRKGSKGLVKEPSSGFAEPKADLPALAASQNNSNEYFSFKQRDAQPHAESATKIGIIDEGIDLSGVETQPVSARINPSSNQDATTKSNESLVNIIKSSKQFGPGMKGLATIRSTKNYHSMTNSINQPMSTLGKLQAQQQFKRATSQESINAHQNNQQTQSQANRLVSVDQVDGDFTQKTAEFFHKTQSAAVRRESPVVISSLPNIQQLSNPLLKENDSQAINLADGVQKDRCASTGHLQETVPQGSKIMPNQHGKFQTKTTRIERKNEVKKTTTSVSSLRGSQNYEQFQSMTKNKSQYFGGKVSGTPQAVNNKMMNSQRLVLNVIRKGPSFAGMSQIATPSGGDESVKATAQNSHRILTKGISHQQIPTAIQALKQHQNQSANQFALNKFAKNAAKSGRNTNNLRTQGSSGQKILRQSYQTSSALNIPQQSANISQTLVQMTASSAVNSKNPSTVRGALNIGSQQQSASQITLPSDKPGSNLRRRTHATTVTTGQGSPVLQKTMPIGQAVKNRNHNTGNLAGMVAINHGLINANYSSTIISKTTESKGSFASSTYNQKIDTKRSPNTNKKVSSKIGYAKGSTSSQVQQSVQQLKQLHSVKSQIRQHTNPQ